MLLVTLAMPFLLVPMVGLAIDATIMYSVKAKLQTAVDGAAIAAAQTLNSGLTFTPQKAAAEMTADQFIRANTGITGPGVTGLWGARNLNDSTCDSHGQPVAGGTNKCINAQEDDANKRRTVTISASVEVPLLFMRILGFSTGQVTATGQAARRDVVLVLVLDRSSSMSDIANMRAGAAYFTKNFQAGRDRLGLVVFGGSGIIAYPTTDWPKDVMTQTLNGPDVHFMDDDGDSPTTPAAVPNMLTSIKNIAKASNTGTAEALTLAYKELLAANQPGALNVIVLFTDGLPNGITSYFNQRGVNPDGGAWVRSGLNKDPNPSPCTYPQEPAPKIPPPVYHPIIGWLAQWGDYKSGPSTTLNGHGVFTLMQTDSSTNGSVTGWLKSGTEPIISPVPAASPSSGCAFTQCNKCSPPYAASAVTYHDEYVSKDVVIPAQDYYGNSTLGVNSGLYTTNDYQQAEIWDNTAECKNSNRIGSLSTATLGYSWDACVIGLASWNAADMAAKKIREDATGLKPIIYTMGYEGSANGKDDPTLMRRISNINVSSNTVYDSTKPEGMYIQIKTVDDITPAFEKILAEILRLAM